MNRVRLTVEVDWDVRRVEVVGVEEVQDEPEGGWFRAPAIADEDKCPACVGCGLNEERTAKCDECKGKGARVR